MPPGRFISAVAVAGGKEGAESNSRTGILRTGWLYGHCNDQLPRTIKNTPIRIPASITDLLVRFISLKINAPSVNEIRTLLLRNTVITDISESS